ncbi:MAG: hypothetical protein QMC74_19880 [Myxococcota bacterium]|jgi:hypothetical protein
MKFGLMFANVGPFGQPEGLTHLAQIRVGVSRFVLGPPGFAQDDVEKGLEKLGNELFSKF